MPEILPVSTEANVSAVRRQLARVRDNHVALDLPHGWTGLDNMARMRLVQRQAQIQKCELALITQDEATRKAAHQLGIPVFRQREDLPNTSWRMHPPLPPITSQDAAAVLPESPSWQRADIIVHSTQPRLRQARQRRIRIEELKRRPLPFWLQMTGYLFMGAVVVGALSFFALYVLPAATITLVPGREAISVSIQLTADPSLDAPDLDANQLPGRLVETTLDETGTIVTSGSQQKPTDNATGSVVFNNLGNSPVEIPVGTIVSTSTGTPITFRTTDTARLDGGVGTRVTVPIESLEPGIAGNVRANTINTVSGALRFRVRVINPNGTVDGGSRLVPIVTQLDKDTLLAQAQKELEEKAFASLQEELEPGEWLPPESVQVFTIAQAFDKFNDDEGGELNLTLRALVQGTALDQEETSDFILASLRQNVPQHGMLVADSVRVQRVPGAVAVGRQVVFTMTGTAEYVIPIDPLEVKRTVAGLAPDEAVDILAQQWPLAHAPEIYRDPQWLATLPEFKSRIQVRVEYAGSLDTP